jgi:glyoxylase-like metal-dependent hydrolase (beta-lactamase superfamily II)
MREVADGVFQLSGFPPNGVNVFLAGDVLVDAGTPLDGGRILRQVGDGDVGALALTHAHPDHQGSSHRVCERLGIPYWAGARDADAAENPALVFERMGIPSQLGVFGVPLVPGAVGRFASRAMSGPGHPVDRTLAEGDEVGDFTVLDTPGHTAGHVSLWREADRVLIAGDAIWNLPRLTLPYSVVNSDHALARESAKRLAALAPDVVCFGHGPPLRDARRLAELAAKL